MVSNTVKEKGITEEEAKKELLTNAGIGLDLFVQNREDIAEQFYKVRPFFYDDIGLFWLWNVKELKYEKKDKIDLMVEIRRVANNKNFSIIGQKFWGETIRALQVIGRNHRPKPFKKTWIQFKSKIYDYVTKEEFDATSEYFNVNPIPYEMGDTTETPIIDKIFGEWVGKKYVLTLKETIALGTIPDYILHRIIYLFGAGLNGKGCFLRFVTRFFGVNNVCSSTLVKILKSNFECSKLYKKLVCLMGETDFSTLTDTAIIKQLTGQDLISAEFKGINSFDFENYALIFIGANSLPMTLDKTKGFYRRPMIIDFSNEFPEGKDILETIPDIEYNNLCKQIIDMLPKLIERGRFDVDGDIQEREKRYEDKSNPLKLFVRETYIDSVNEQIPFFELFDDFIVFCKDRGFRELAKKNVSNLLEAMGYETEKKDIKKPNGDWTRWTFVMGLKYISTRSTSSTLHVTQDPIRRNGVQPVVERVEEVEFLSFERSLVSFQACSIQNCNNTECNLSGDGKPYCQDHWDEYAVK